MIKVDLHNHTILCNHAEGKLSAYVEAAIASGIDIYGVSDHAPMNFDPKYRMSFEQIPTYESMISTVKEKYKEKIDVLFAYEVDYLPGHMDKRILEADVDYLIGSAHGLRYPATLSSKTMSAFLMACKVSSAISTKSVLGINLKTLIKSRCPTMSK